MKLNLKFNSFMKKILLITIISVFSSVLAFGQYIWSESPYFSISEPSDVQFTIEWGMASEITSIWYYYWDELNEYQEVIVNPGIAYNISENNLTILQTWIEALSPEGNMDIRFYAIFNTESESHFNINVVYSHYSSIFEDSKLFDLSNKDDVFVTVLWANSQEITSITKNGVLIPSSNYTINGDWLFIKKAYLNTVLLTVGNTIDLTVTFDNNDTDTFEIEAINTGVTNPSLSQNEFEFSENDVPEYLETIITWNSATEISSMEVLMIDNGYPMSMDFDDYVVIPINASTATLRINMGEEKSSQAKTIDYFYVSIKITFDAGSPLYIFLSLYDEYYQVQTSVTPLNGGWTDGGNGEYSVGEEIHIEAYSNSGFTFSKWLINGSQEITENPYTFIMPDNDVNIKAYFLSDYPIVLQSNPQDGQNDVDITTSIYLTFDRNIIEGTTNNGFNDITLQDGMSNQFPINSFSILSGNILVIQPTSPFNINTYYSLNIPAESIEDAANLGLHMNNSFWMNFSTGWGDFEHGLIDPDEGYYSLLETGDVDFNINWGDETSINSITYYYWDDVTGYQEDVLISPADYIINGNILTITNTFISSLSTEVSDELDFYAMFESGWQSNFQIRIVQTSLPYISPDALTYDLSNPDNIFTTIIYNNAESIISVANNSVNLTAGTDYHIDGTWLFIHNSYLSTHLLSVGNEISLNITFNTEDQSTLTITTIQSGIINATIDPESQTFNNNEVPEYVDLTITWNSASSVSNLTVWDLDDGILTSYDHSDYTVTPINSETATLRIIFGAKNLTYTKTTDEFNVLFEIEFNLGASAFYYITVIDEFFFLHVDIYPTNTGYVSSNSEYSLNEEVHLEAYPNWGYEFLCWKINGEVVSTENTYIFNMPANDLYLTAFFVPEGATLYDLTLISNPIGACVLSGAGQYIVGETVNINLTANTGYEFVNWTDAESNEVASTIEHSFIMLNQDITLTANFIDNTNVDIVGADAFQVYPNPFSDILYINNYQSAIKITFTTITGQIITELTNPGNGQINTADLPKGFYLLIIENKDGQRIVKKIVKQ